jgi:hypothetical protein
MFEMYKKENEEFTKKLGITQYHVCHSMKEYLDKIFDEN